MQYLFNTKHAKKKWFKKATWKYIKDMLKNTPEGIRWYWKRG